MKFASILSLTLAFAVGGFAIPATAQTIADLVVATSGEFDDNPKNYDILLAALVAADLVGPVADPNASLTVFAPNDGAFKKLASDLGWAGGSEAEAWEFLVGALTELGEGDPIPVLSNVLLYHVVGRTLTFQEIILAGARRQPIMTLLGATILPRGIRLVDNAPALMNPKLVIPSSFSATNGNIFTIDRVLVPVALP
jgi:serralysin